MNFLPKRKLRIQKAYHQKQTSQGKAKNSHIGLTLVANKAKSNQNLLDDFLLKVITETILGTMRRHQVDVGNGVIGWLYLVPKVEPLRSCTRPIKQLKAGIVIAKEIGHLGVRSGHELGRLSIEFEGHVAAVALSRHHFRAIAVSLMRFSLRHSFFHLCASLFEMSSL